jgi:hypothetical protein
MSPLKSTLHGICSEVAAEFEGWHFAAGAFKNTAPQHSTLEIDLGLSFARGSTPLQPTIRINHKRSMAIFKQVSGYGLPTSIVPFQNIPHLLQHVPEELRISAWILSDKNLHMSLVSPSKEQQRGMIDVAESRSVLRAVLMDGAALFGKLYDLGSEESFLRNFPPKYETRSEKIPYDEFERDKGIMACIVHFLLGDLDFVHEYRSDRYKTIFPKKITQLDKLISIFKG